MAGNLRTLRGLISEIRRSSSDKKIKDSLLVQHLLQLYKKNQVTDEQLCREQFEMARLAETYSCYLSSSRRYMAIKDEYHGKGERSVRDTANMVGFKLPHDPK
ncbi:protein FMC1 homolog [Neocloeon triangulifer]|uniref:protein FMC1 homolog n=1 Tax=Neocloeon triangulifer TaxID=2078957 RepID=UPI00286F1EE9|nr:protein FMC1 homolog [Neocloeon triangulifer]